jgi:sialate O-acetylesterase
MKKITRIVSIIAISFLLFSSCTLFKSPATNVKVQTLFTDHMVLQKGVILPVWGTADPGGKVSVSINGQKKTDVVLQDSTWRIDLDPMEYGGPYQMQIIGAETIALENVVVGEVWVASGQSNMQWTVARSNNQEEEIAAAQYPNIRLFQHERVLNWKPQTKVSCDGWQVCSPETIEEFSAVAYFFGRHLNQELDVPIGIIHTSWGGTPAEAWTSSASLKLLPDYAPIVKAMEADSSYVKNLQAEYDEKLQEWQKLKDSGAKDLPRKPRGILHSHRPTVLYNAMINPLIPYAIKGAIWYQGESNANRAFQYRSLFQTMITDWRTQWKQGDFSFYFVQLANFKARKAVPADDDWAELREAQNLALGLPNTGMAVTIDIGQADDIHPRNKQDVGKRLALNALKLDYGKDIVHSGPVYKSMAVEGNSVRLTFDHVGSGLTTRAAELVGFAIAGKDSAFTWAEAKIDGETVVVNSPYVENPIAVRYAWASNPMCNLYNNEGLPASPFRTDEWPGLTWPKEGDK